MTNDEYKKAIDRLLKTYSSLAAHAERIVSKLKKISNAGIRSKLTGELRSLDRKRLELLDQIDALPKPN
jgi:predicted  nucleic acid-binding Zn-ribbon protein